MVVNQFGKWVIFGCLTLFSVKCLAYSVPNHKRVTDQAIDLINHCEVGLTITMSQRKALKKYNVGQDKLLKKAVLWHFPQPLPESDNPAPHKSRASGYGKVVVDTTFERWVNYLDIQAHQQAEPDERVQAIGGILHFLQDMAVPSHAVPIFHPSKIANADLFDSWDGFAEDSNLIKQMPCIQLDAGKVMDVGSFIGDARRETLNSLKQVHTDSCGENQLCTWELFWPTTVEQHGFAHYGCDKEDKFGQDGEFECAGNHYNIAQQTYSDFATQRFVSSVIDSANLILYYMTMQPTRAQAV